MYGVFTMSPDTLLRTSCTFNSQNHSLLQKRKLQFREGLWLPVWLTSHIWAVPKMWTQLHLIPKPNLPQLIAPQWDPTLPPPISLWPSCCPACCCSVAKSCPTLCSPMDCSMPGFPVPHHLPEFAQVHVHCIGEYIDSNRWQLQWYNLWNIFRVTFLLHYY